MDVRRALASVALLVAAAGTVSAMPRPGGGTRIPATSADFRLPGTQPDPDMDAFLAGVGCSSCHGGYDPNAAPVRTWVASMMAQSARDPIWHASLAIANQDVAFAGEFCIRCHAPGAWMGGRGAGGTLANFWWEPDFDGVNCMVCHRMVNPETGPLSAVGYASNVPYDPDPDPEVLSPLAAAGMLPGPGQRTNGSFVVDPRDTRRGPFADIPVNYHGVPMHHSPFHSTSEMCATCHDVSNVMTVRRPDGSWGLDSLGTPHPTARAHDMFPEQRTYSEWLNSQFAREGVPYPDRRFGGNHPTGVMRTCQDCHMPDTFGAGCSLHVNTPYVRPDVPQHGFAGANSWVVRAVRAQLGPDEADAVGLFQSRVDAAIARNVQMLRDASDMTLAQVGPSVKVRIVNQSGHKLPTGISEGRRMWINVRFVSASGATVDESGAYDWATGTLLDPAAKQYGAHMVTDGEMAEAAGLPEGAEFHIALLNKVAKDNRIPPRGFSNASYAAFGGEPVGAAYADGQHWDDTLYPIPAGATRAIVTLWHQTTTREYAEFLRDQNRTDQTGQVAYDLWVQFGRSAPVSMDTASIDLSSACTGADLNCDGAVDGDDLGILLGAWGTPTADLNGDGTTDGNDLGILLGDWG